MFASGFELVFLLFFSGSSSSELPLDLLGFLEPQVALSLLEKKTDADSLEKLITPGKGGGGAGVLKIALKEVENAIQNLASSSQGVRERAREKLLAAGAGVKKRLEEVVASDRRRAAEAKKVLALLEGKESAAVHEDDLARTLAIRLAAAKKLIRLVPSIEKAASAKNPFVKLAAEDALIRLGKKTKSSEDSSKTVAASLKLGLEQVEALPSDTKLLVALDLNLPQPGETKGLTLADFMKKMAGGFPIPPEQIDEGIREGSREMLNWIRTYGNMRPERAYIANVGLIDNEGGGLGIIVQGFYQPGVLRKALGGDFWTTSEVAGKTVYNSPFLRVVFLSEHTVLILPQMASLRFPLEKYLENLSKGKKALAGSERFAQFLATLTGKDQVRGLALTDSTLLSELHEELDRDPNVPPEIAKAVKAMSEVELTLTRLEDGKTRVRFESVFGSGEDSEALTGYLEGLIKQGIAEMEQQAQQIPIPVMQNMMKKFIDIMKAIKLSAEGKRGILRVELPEMKLEEILGATFGTRTSRVRVAR